MKNIQLLESSTEFSGNGGRKSWEKVMFLAYVILHGSPLVVSFQKLMNLWDSTPKFHLNMATILICATSSSKWTLIRHYLKNGDGEN